MPIWKAKAGPVLTKSRFAHFGEALAVASLCGHLWGYEGVAWATVTTIIAGLGWELSNKLTGKGFHPYADLVDFWAFMVGTGVASIVTLILPK